MTLIGRTWFAEGLARKIVLTGKKDTIIGCYTLDRSGNMKREARIRIPTGERVPLRRHTIWLWDSLNPAGQLTAGAHRSALVSGALTVVSGSWLLNSRRWRTFNGRRENRSQDGGPCDAMRQFRGELRKEILAHGQAGADSPSCHPVG